MTNTTTPTPTASAQINAQVASRYEGLSFVPNSRPADRSGNFRRAARKTTTRRTIR